MRQLHLTGSRLTTAVVAVAAAFLNATAPLAHAGDARWAADFDDSVGVNVHMSYYDTPYRDSAAVARYLTLLGVHHVRDGVLIDAPPAEAALAHFGALGIRSNLVVQFPRQDGAHLARALAAIEPLARAGYVDSLEGPNEYDRHGDPLWVTALRDFQPRLFGALRAQPFLANLPLLTPALGDVASYPQLGNISQSAAFGNFHQYVTGQPPDRPGLLQADLARVRQVAGNRPVIASEAGYHNAIRATRGQPPVSEAAAAAYLPRLLLNNFRGGVVRTYVYELRDEFPDSARQNQERHFGLIRYDGTPKPAFASIANLLHVLGDTAQPVGPPASLDYRWDGDVGGLQDLLLQKHDGTFWLVAWRNDSMYDLGRRRDAAPPPRPATLHLPTAYSVSTFAPATGTQQVGATTNVRDLALPLGGTPLVLRLDPQQAATLTAPSISSSAGTNSRVRLGLGQAPSRPMGVVDHFQVEARNTRSRRGRSLGSNIRVPGVVLRGRQGRTFRVRARAVNREGLAGPWAYAVTSVPLDDRSRVFRFSGGWKRHRVRGTFGRSLSVTSRRGAHVSVRVRGATVYVIGRTNRRGGKASITINGRRRVVSFYSARTRTRAVIARLRGRRRGVNRLTVRALGRKGGKRSRGHLVEIDGVAAVYRG